MPAISPERPILCALAGIALACNACASPAWQWVSIDTLPGFDNAQPQLQALIDHNGHRAINHVCVIGQKSGTHAQAEVFWPEENKLILWVPNLNDPQTLVHSKRYLDLERDVRTDPGTSTYLLSSAFVAETLKACAAHGTRFVIQKAPKTPPDNG